MESKKKYRLAILCFIVFLLFSVCYNLYFGNKGLKNGIVVKATVTNIFVINIGKKIDVAYLYKGKKYAGDYIADEGDAIRVNDQILLKISTDPLGKYVEFLKRVK